VGENLKEALEPNEVGVDLLADVGENNANLCVPTPNIEYHLLQ
jgi:hypothetical protein